MSNNVKQSDSEYVSQNWSPGIVDASRKPQPRDYPSSSRDLITPFCRQMDYTSYE